MLLWGHRGRAYFEARSRGKSPEEAAQEAHDALETGTPVPQPAPRVTDLPSNYRPVRLEYRVHVLATINRILAVILLAFAPIWIVGWLSTVPYVDQQSGTIDFSKGGVYYTQANPSFKIT